MKFQTESGCAVVLLFSKKFSPNNALRRIFGARRRSKSRKGNESIFNRSLSINMNFNKRNFQNGFSKIEINLAKLNASVNHFASSFFFPCWQPCWNYYQQLLCGNQTKNKIQICKFVHRRNPMLSYDRKQDETKRFIFRSSLKPTDRLNRRSNVKDCYNESI